MIAGAKSNLYNRSYLSKANVITRNPFVFWNGNKT